MNVILVSAKLDSPRAYVRQAVVLMRETGLEPAAD